MIGHFSGWDWTLCAIAAFCIGMSKTGFGGVALISVALMASVLPARQSIGVVLPLLIFADCFAVRSFRQHARWSEIRRVLPPALVGVVLGAGLLRILSQPGVQADLVLRRLVGGIILALTLLQAARFLRPGLVAPQRADTSRLHAWAMGGLSGITSMLANAAGPVMSLYLLAVGLPKLELVATSAWFFLILNVAKLPFNFQLGNIGTDTLQLNLLLLPGVVLGVYAGRGLLRIIPEARFQGLLLAFALVASVRLLWA